MESTGLKILVIDCVEKDTLPLGGVDGWFRVALAKCDPRVEVKTVRASTPDWEKEVAWADAVMISGSPRDAFVEDEWTHALMAKVARLLEKKKPVLGVCYGHQILGRVRISMHDQGRCREDSIHIESKNRRASEY